MDGAPTSFWAKLDQDERGTTLRWHPLVDHCADVAACFAELIERPVIRRRLATVAGLAALSDTQAARLAALAALHDLGKFNHGFQARAWPDARDRCGHVREALALFDHEDGARLAEALGFGEMERWGATEDTMSELLATAIAHHGRPVPARRGDHRPHRWRPANGRDPMAGVADLAALAKGWFPLAFTDGGEPLPASPALQHAFNGLLTLADWIGSDENIFPFTRERHGGRFAWARERAREAVTRLGLDVTRPRAALGPASPSFASISEYAPRAVQSAVHALPAEEGGSLTILESETGSGKTEAALARFMTLFHAGVVDGLYFALPTRTAATQIHARVVAAVELAFPEGARPAVTLAVPGYIRVDDTSARQLAPFKVLWQDDVQDYWRFRGWAAERPKRFLASAIAVGTIDQVLLSGVRVPHAHLRAAGLLRHLLVVDEVHASDAYMTRLLESVLARHRRAGGHALLMSATLGAAARDRLLRPGRHASRTPLAEAVRVPYPALTHAPAGEEPVTHGVPSGSQSKVVHVRTVGAIASPDEIASLAVDAARRGARVLVVRNTVKDCVATQEAVERIACEAGDALLFRCAGVPMPHHARFTREDRKLLDDALEAALGKGSREGGCVAVATQTVQQSLDIDADRLITDLCPMDVLLQRIGRLHRHPSRVRPMGLESPEVAVLVPDDRDLTPMIRRDGSARGPHGFGFVYDDLLILEATWRLLERFARIEIPRMNRELVEGAVHPEVLEAIANERGEPWLGHWHHTLGSRSAHAGIARNALVDWDQPFGDQPFGGDLGEAIRTRLGADDRSVSFALPLTGPFLTPVSELTIPGHMARGAAADAAPLDIEAGERYIRFSFGGRRYRYDRLGLRAEQPEKADNESADA